MILEQLLKAQGLTDEQITAIMGGMKENKIYLSAEENIDTRYKKLKDKYDVAVEELGEANKTIQTLETSTKGQEDLQTQIENYKLEVEKLQKESSAKIRNLAMDTAINSLLKDQGVKYPELLSAKFDRDSIVVNDDGEVDMASLEKQFTPMKETYKELIGAPAVPMGRIPNPKGGTIPVVDSKRSQLEALINDMTKPLAERIAAKNQLFSLSEEE